MKKSAIILFLFAFACQNLLGQAIVATGTVSNQDGLPLRYAFVYDKQSKSATYTDSLGGFKLHVNQGEQLTITCKGYMESTVTATDKGAASITLKKDLKATAGSGSNTDEAVVEDAFKSVHDNLGNPGFTSFGQATFTSVKETRGSQFLFNQWVHGYLIDTKGNIVQAPSLLLNYNKMTGDLFMTEDKNSVITADKNHIKSFVLFSPLDQQYTFELMPGISTDHFCQVLSAGSKYKVYKLTITKFNPSDYHTDGVVSTGNLYDEYTDKSSYYVSNLTTTVFQPLNLSKKSIRLVFAAEGPKVDAFLSAHRISEDDDWVASLGDAMNQP